MSMDNKTKEFLDKIFDFLKENKEFNSEYQMQEYNWHLAHLETPKERLLSLLHMSVNTQSQPKLGELAVFWRAIHERIQDREITPTTLTEILEDVADISKKDDKPWSRMYHALCAQSGWGEKTAALFIKSSIRIHEIDRKINFWQSEEITQDDQIYLPVDAVIKHIFEDLGLLKRVDFKNINNLLFQGYNSHEILIWDDLWFWGFFTQKKENKKRISVWNSEKFWCQRASPIQKETEVERLAKQFLEIINEIATKADGGKP